MSPTTLGPRLRTRLHEWQAEGRVSWQDFADVQADAISDTDAAISQAIADVEFDDWWLRRNDVFLAERVRAIYEMLKPRNEISDPERSAARVRVLELLAKHRASAA